MPLSTCLLFDRRLDLGALLEQYSAITFDSTCFDEKPEFRMFSEIV